MDDQPKAEGTGLLTFCRATNSGPPAPTAVVTRCRAPGSALPAVEIKR